MQAANIVGQLLENDKVTKWANALGSAKNLYGLKQKSLGIFQEMIRCLAYEHALAKAGLERKDVSHILVGAMIGATHNYKGTMPAKQCTNPHCSMGRTKRLLKNTMRREKYMGVPDEAETEVCPECQEPITAGDVQIPPSHLRDKMARHIVGVETVDGKNVFFDKPVSPEPWMEADVDNTPMPKAKTPMKPEDLVKLI